VSERRPNSTFCVVNEFQQAIAFIIRSYNMMESKILVGIIGVKMLNNKESKLEIIDMRRSTSPQEQITFT